MNVKQLDIVKRLKSVLPARWFGEITPVLDTVLDGLAAGWDYLFEFLQYVRDQTRLSTATDVWLDLIAYDYFGAHVVRRTGQSDGAFRQSVLSELLRPRATRHAIMDAIFQSTCRLPIVFEPANTADTGGYGYSDMTVNPIGGGVGYGEGGGWGNLSLPYQSFVTAFRPIGNGIANISGWGFYDGGYGSGCLQYADIDMIQGHLSDDDILGKIKRTSPVGVVIWARIAS
jgi:hypothetical protein